MTKKIIFILIFLEGFLVMGIELSSSLIIKPFFGNSMEVWTFILGITLFALTCGYFFGAWLSKKTNTLLIIYFLFILLSIAIYLIPFVSKYFFRQIIDYEVTTILSISIPPFLFPPLFLLGAISTLIVNSFSKNGYKASKSAALTYFTSTIAGVISLLIIAFYLVEKYSTFSIIYLLSFVAILALFLLHFALKTSKYFYSFIFLYTALTFYYFSSGAESIKDVFPNHIKELYNNDGILGQIIVLKDYGAKTKMLLVNNTTQTGTDFYGRGNYYHVKKISDFLTKTKFKGSVLIAGLGGGSLVYELSKNNVQIDVVELDKRMIEVSRKFFLLPDTLNVNFITDDARHLINSSQKTYNAIILDLSIGESIPSNVYTLESFKRIKHLLSDDGKLFINFFSLDTKEGLEAIQAIGNTLFHAGLSPKLLKRNTDSLHLSSYVFYASKTQNNKSVEDSLCMNFEYKKGEILNDDNSKLDIIHKNIILKQRKDYIFNYQKYFQKL